MERQSGQFSRDGEDNLRTVAVTLNPLEKITWSTKRNESSIQLLSEEIIKMMVFFPHSGKEREENRKK